VRISGPPSAPPSASEGIAQARRLSPPASEPAA
jgi:hypothetical protein